jgi:predicted ribosomally synthesized peptide with SipW-like signal peptide
MTEYEFDLSRRKVLGAIGAVGAASAGAGLGTSALFSDQESFEDNQLVSGELDLKVDWEEHYSFPQIYDLPDPADGLDVTRTPPDDTAGYVPLPDPANPLVWVVAGDLDAYMSNTAIESYPDTDGDGSQDPFGATTNEVTVGDVCTDGADLSQDLDPTVEGALRTRNADTYDEEAEAYNPLIDLDDVKPGDFGELTLSFHLCDNPGYIWLQGQPIAVSEGGITDPEADSSDAGASDESLSLVDGDTVGDMLGSDVELLDEIQTVWWYDDGDNVLGRGSEEAAGGKVDLAFIHDRSGSMDNEASFLQTNITSVATQLQNSNVDAAFGLVPYESNSDGTDGDITEVVTDITTDATQLDFSFTIGGGTENASEAIEFALDNLTFRPDAKKILVVITDEDDDGSPAERTAALNRVDQENACLLAVSPNTTGSDELKTMSEQVQCGDWINITDGLSQQIINELVGFVTTVGGEEVIYRGSLRDSLTALSSGKGIPLDGDQSTPFDEIAGSETAPERDCYQPLTTNYLGFAWWLPTSVGNEVQSDSVSFDLGFYTEQCRHNDGSGQQTA